MGKTIKKNQSVRVARTRESGSFVVKGKRHALSVCNSAGIADYLRSKGHAVGTSVRWNGGAYRLEVENGIERTCKLVRVS